MKKSTRIVLLAAFCLVFGSLAHADSYDFAADTGSNIHFDGAGGFSFGSAGFADSHITYATGGLVSLVGLTQDIADPLGGPFVIGTITNLAGGIQTAPVSGSGIYTIWNSPSDFLQGTITWIDITTLGTTGSLNLNGILNVNYGSYSGANAGLSSLAYKAGSATVSFQLLTPSNNLAFLKENVYDRSFSGTVSNFVPDGGTTLILLGGALIGLTTLRRKFRV